ncbi:hypothetical protein H4R20_002437 [Coemansia guatemalensis]|uniref:ABC transmembrane type-1 domain-containing protein n=1 Tax=Coemansia guatemalensis TaxID=2761395 RepID=A0A9W8HX84_9FUNG|nr:hypothetical protein H4R20_002437 [Coemansia guatemalensis]
MEPETSSAAQSEHSSRADGDSHTDGAAAAGTMELSGEDQNAAFGADALTARSISAGKTYAEVAAAAGSEELNAVGRPMTSDSHSPAESAEGQYATDDYTEDNYSDEYTEESIFSDSNYSSRDGDEVDSRNGESHDNGDDGAAFAKREAVRSNEGLETSFSSGAVSPNPSDMLNPSRAAEALAPSHRFVSHTPWGSSTGRLTSDQRQKDRPWVNPNATSELGQQQFPTLIDTPHGVPQTLTRNDSRELSNGAGATAMGNQQDGDAYGQGHAPGNIRPDYLHALAATHNQPGDMTYHGASQQQQQQQQQLYNHHQHEMPQQQQPHGAAMGQVVNVVSVQQGTKNYSQLQQQIQREQMLQKDTIDGKLVQGQRGTRIVTIAQFVKSVSRLLGIGFPSIGCTEARLAAALVAVLGVRTGLDVWFANFNARCVRAVVTYDRATLLRRLLPEYLGMMLPMAAVNQTIKWVISSLTIALRVRLGRYAHERYVDGITNITWNQLHHQGLNGSTPAYERPDWLLTVQIHRFADMFPRLLADVVKPTMDWFVFSRLLSRVIGRKGSLTMVLYVVLANIVIRLCSPPTGKHASHLAQLEEKYRSVYGRVSSIIQRAAAASTPIVFQQKPQGENSTTFPSPGPSPHATTPHALEMRQVNGQPQRQQTFVPRVQAAFRQKAKDALDSSLDNVASSVVSTNIRRFFGGIGETILAKYGATLTAYYLLSRPLCSPGRRLASEILHDPAAVMMSYSRNSAYLINLSQATTRLLLMVNDLPKFVWSTVKVDRLLRSLDVHSRYRSAVENLPDDVNSNSSQYSTD